MTRIRRGGYVFQTWVGDHLPPHVHVYLDGRLLLKWETAGQKPMIGRVPGKLLKVIRQLEAEGKL